MVQISWMPEQASTWAGRVDFINDFITAVAIFCTIAICGAMLYFAVKYRRRSANDKTAYITHGALIETVWTVVPTIVCMYVFWYGYDLGHEMRTPPANPVEINVQGQKWRWDYEYSNGKRATEELMVPVGKPVRLIMKSADVNHSFFIPAMRIKEDVIGNNYTYLWFEATKTGEFPIFCTEYCGGGHSSMRGMLKVVPQDVFDDFINDRGPKVVSPEALGAKLYVDKGCKGCHSIDGSRQVGPSFKGLFGREESIVGKGKVLVDENYIRRSILEPMAELVEGYPPGMQMYTLVPEKSGPTTVTEQDLAALIAYLKTLK